MIDSKQLLSRYKNALKLCAKVNRLLKKGYLVKLKGELLEGTEKYHLIKNHRGNMELVQKIIPQSNTNWPIFEKTLDFNHGAYKTEKEFTESFGKIEYCIPAFKEIK